MTNKSTAEIEDNDAELVSRSLAGDRGSFDRIVVRYQTLICSLAYNALGDIGQSEDVSQETFITAWNRLRQLREPANLRGWLCGIVRNRIHKNLDREGREPARHAETLEAEHDTQTSDAIPSEETISKEEQAILWRSLKKIPLVYREPLILFYREHQSIEAVARELELSEDAVKQRLSRGRKLLQEEVQAFVENTLRRTAPGRAFSGAVLAALPAAPATTVGVGAAGKAATAAKSGFMGAWLAPIIAILGGMAAHWLIVRAAPTARERRLKKFAFIGLWIFVLGWCIPGQLGMGILSKHLEWSDHIFFRMMAVFWWFYAIVVATMSIVMFRRISAIRQESEEIAGGFHTTGQPPTVSTHIAVVAGVHVACFWWLIDLAWRAHDQASAGVLTGIMVALAIWNVVRLRGRTGVAVARAVAGHQALVWGIILVILNFRLEAWEASLRGIDPAEMHRLLPVWIIPLLTLTVVAWVGLMLRITNPKRFLQTLTTKYESGSSQSVSAAHN
jgi:RNA polymerase sigma factor (sigma-70 family)